MRKKVTKSTMIKKITTAVMLSLTIFSAIPVFAGTGNYSWFGYAQTPGSSIRTGTRTKETDSSVIANYSDGSSEFMGVTVLVKDKNGSWDDCTYYTSSHPIYYAYKGTSNYIDVLNTAYEENGRCTVAARFTATTAGNHSGKWRPDYQ